MQSLRCALCSMASSQRYDGASEALRAIAIIAALIITALFPGIFSGYEKVEDLGYGVNELSPEDSKRVRMYMRAGCASAVALASGAIVAALAVQIAIAACEDPNMKYSRRQLNVGYLISLYLLIL